MSSCWPPSPGGLGLADLAALFAEMYERARGDVPDQDPGREFADREREAGHHDRRGRAWCTGT